MNREILLLVDALAHEKNVEKETIFIAVEFALASATKKRYKDDVDIRVAIDRRTGEYLTFRRWQYVAKELLENPAMQIDDSDTRAHNLPMGEFYEEALENVEFSRISAQAAKQVILQKVREAEREKILADFFARDEKLVSGTIKRMDKGHAFIEVGKMECILPRDQMIPKENLRVGDRIRAYVLRVETNNRGHQLVLSRICPELIIRLFELEVPEIESGLLEIRSAARDPGLRAKIAVKTNDQRLDPVGTCVGVKGSRVQAVTNELAGERVDIVLWSLDSAQFVINAMSPAEVSKIVVDEDAHTIDIIVEEDQLALAIGRNGQNVRLASELTGWKLNILTTSDAQQKNQEEFSNVMHIFMEQLDVDEEVADILVKEGFTTLEEIAYIPVEEIADIDAFDDAMIEELRKRARTALLKEAIAKEEQVRNVSSGLMAIEGMDNETAHLLASNGITTVDDLADLAVDELVELTQLSNERATQLIMTARAPLFT